MAIQGLILASLRRQWGLYLLWVISLCAAVSGLAVIDVYRSSLAETLKVQGAKILSAHVSISSRRALSDEERTKFKGALPAGTQQSEVTEMFAMVSTDKASRLAALRFIDDSYPLAGVLETSEAVKGANLAGDPQIWIASDLIPLMGLREGAKLKVGKQEFTVRGVVKKDSSVTFRVGSMAPRIYLHKKFLAQTGLMQFGTTFSETIYALLPGEIPADLKKQVEAVVRDPAVQITVPADLEQGSLRVLSRLLDYLGLIGLVTLALGWIGVYYLGRRWLMLEQPSGGLLKTLGFTSSEVTRLWLLKLTIVLTVGVIVGGFGAWLGSNAVVPLFRNGLPEDFVLIWSWRSSFVLLLVGPAMGWLLLSEMIYRAAHMPALELVNGASPGARSAKLWLLLTGGVSLLAISLTFLQARSWVVTYSFLGALIGSVVIVVALGFLSLAVVATLPRQGWLWHMVSALWLRRPGLAVLMVTVSALCGLLSQLIPHLEKTLVGELRSPPTLERPGLFMFDVQDEQMEPLKAMLQSHGVEISQQSPFIRARLLKVNGRDFEREDVNSWSTREEENNARLRNRGVNLSYREKLGPAEQVIEGKSFDKMSVSPAELSIEDGYANRMGLKMGDDLLFDVQGVEVPAKIANVRLVNWDSFEPNFFMQLRPGVIDGAPKTWVVTLKRNPAVTPMDVQRWISKDFSNVTSINVEEAIDAISGLLVKLGGGLRIASRLSLGLGLFVFVMILMFQLVSMEKDWVQLHRQGLRSRDLLLLQLAAYGSLSVWGAMLGSGLSLFVCWALSRWTFDARPQFDWLSLAQILGLTCLLSVSALIALSRRQFRTVRRLSLSI